MSTAEPIHWGLAEKVAARIAGREPFADSYLGASLESDFVELTREAEALVEAETGLRSVRGPARVRVVQRPGWVHANVTSFRRMLFPLTERLGRKMANSFLAPVTSRTTGAQVGVVLGWTSTRVLGQYDLLLFEDDHPEEQDFVYYVGPNVLALEKRFAFPPREFRLWLALHECTHRAQFTGVPWLASYFKQQVQSIMGESEADNQALSATVKHLAQDVRSGKNPLADGGVLALVASPEQQDALKRIYGLMSLLEGHGEVIMAKAGADRIPSAERFHRVLHARRASARGLAKVMQRVLGMEAKLRQYAEGAEFIRQVEEHGGRELFDNVWVKPENLPTYDEIKDPSLWIARMERIAVS